MTREKENEILAHLSGLKNRYSEGEVFVTEKVSYLMRNVTKRARKNYLGIYDQPLDSVTKDEKYFPPLTEAFTDAVIKSIDFDTKDVDLYSMNGASVGAAKVMRQVVRAKLNEARFGETLNKFLQYLAIDGHGVLKFVDDYDPIKKKRVFRIDPVDMLSLYVDQSADSLNDSDGYLERTLMTEEQFRNKKKVWKNTDEAAKATTLSRTPLQYQGAQVETLSPYYVIYEYWGKIEKCWATEQQADEGVWVEGHIVCSSIGDNASRIHLIEVNDRGIRPYDDVPLQKVIGRLQGRGIPEKLFGTQKYLNGIVNIRKKNSMILQQGLFKAKRSLGLTSDSILSKITVGGVIQVNEQDDFTPVVVPDVRQASYADEDRIVGWGERAAGVPDIRRGELEAASAPATASLIRDRNSRDLFQLVQENVGLMLERFIQNNVVPWIVENVKDGEVVSINGSLRDLEEYDNAIAEHLVNKKFVAYVEKNKAYPKPEEVAKAKEEQLKALRSLGRRRYTKLSKQILSGEYGVLVTVGSNDIDKGTVLQKLQEILTLGTANPGALDIDTKGVLDAILDILNIPQDKVYASKKVQAPVAPTPATARANAAAASQPLNKLLGSVAPQANSAGPAPQSSQAMVQEATQRYGR